MNGCPAIVLPIKPGSPLLAWDTLTLAQIQKIGKENGVLGEGGFMWKHAKVQGIVRVIFEFASLCVDWERVVLPAGALEGKEKESEEGTKEAVQNAIALLVFGAMKTSESKQVQDEVDADRAGIVMFRMK